MFLKRYAFVIIPPYVSLSWSHFFEREGDMFVKKRVRVWSGWRNPYDGVFSHDSVELAPAFLAPATHMRDTAKRPHEEITCAQLLHSILKKNTHTHEDQIFVVNLHTRTYRWFLSHLVQKLLSLPGIYPHQ